MVVGHDVRTKRGQGKQILKDRKRLNESSWTKENNGKKRKKEKDIGEARRSSKPLQVTIYRPPIASPFKLIKTALFFIPT
jgi:hypothetical protein